MLKTFNKLRQHLLQLSPEDYEPLIFKANQDNAWFTKTSVLCAFDGIIQLLEPTALQQFRQQYPFLKTPPKKIAIIMAGNIPMVGFHDIICTLLSGHTALIKPSRQDRVLITFLCDTLKNIDPDLVHRLTFVEYVHDADAIIATGSNNTSRYFEQYFAKMPHIIRKNRQSIAILSADWQVHQLANLGKDIFTYFGLGCRNVSKIYVPNTDTIQRLLDYLSDFASVADMHKYFNNYEYQKSIFLINGVPHFDNGFLLVTAHQGFYSPLSVLYYEVYDDFKKLQSDLQKEQHHIQCIVTDQPTGFFREVSVGQTQNPHINDYADGVDTMDFLLSLE